MKLIKSQNKLSIMNAKHIYYIDIADEVDEHGKLTGNSDIDVYFDSAEDSWMQTIGTYRTAHECIQHLDRLASFLSSDSCSGMYEMP
ncbi:MAG: hypothetical protein FWC91_13200 [Defluviitaleaceae bacterium]|nr:hypothetical protein [Defluviitaleaceae bacterium]